VATAGTLRAPEPFADPKPMQAWCQSILRTPAGLRSGCARRLQIRERLTDDIAHAIEDAPQPGGVAVVLVAEHGCMTSRGVHAHGTRMVTKRMLGVFDTNVDLRREFLSSIPV